MLFNTALVSFVLASVTQVFSLNILLTSDDSWAAANVVAAKAALVKDGHNVVLVGPAVTQSGKGGTFVLPTTNITSAGGEFGTIAPGAPYFGRDETDQNLWYFNGTPSAVITWAIDVILPTYYPKFEIDLVVVGPNEDPNNGPYLYQVSGTLAATYVSVERGFSAVAVSAGNTTHRSFTTNHGDPLDPANIAANLTASLVRALAKTKKDGQRILPLGVGLNVNYPIFGPGNPCTAPKFVLTRMTSGATMPQLSINSTTGLPAQKSIAAPGLNAIVNGKPDLPGEAEISVQCLVAVSVFSTDYDAPADAASPIQASLLETIIGKTGF